jgi:hypothetical protein
MPSSRGAIRTSVPAVAKQGPLRRDRVARIAFAHHHLIRPPIRAGRCHGQLFADRPKAQEPDAELSLQPGAPVRFQSPLHRIANVRRDIAKIRPALAVSRHPFAIIADSEERSAMLAPACNRDGMRLGINAVLDQLCDGLQGAALRERNDGNGIPVIAYPQPAPPPARLPCSLRSNRLRQCGHPRSVRRRANECAQ